MIRPRRTRDYLQVTVSGPRSMDCSLTQTASSVRYSRGRRQPGVRLLMQSTLETEATVLQGRERYERNLDACAGGNCNGYTPTA